MCFDLSWIHYFWVYLFDLKKFLDYLSLSVNEVTSICFTQICIQDFDRTSVLFHYLFDTPSSWSLQRDPLKHDFRNLKLPGEDIVRSFDDLFRGRGRWGWDGGKTNYTSATPYLTPWRGVVENFKRWCFDWIISIYIQLKHKDVFRPINRGIVCMLHTKCVIYMHVQEMQNHV